MTTHRPLAAVVVNWNGADHTQRCVAALSASCSPPERIIVVDNGSTDASLERLKRLPGVQLVESGANLGYAGGNNLGIRVALDAGARSILVLNNDVEVERECIVRLERALDGERVGAVGPLLLLPGSPQRIWAAGGAIVHRENVSRLRGNGEPRNGRFAEDEPVDYLPGCALLVKAEVFARVGMLDEAFFCYMEDVEFGRRLAAAGLESRFVAAAVAQHDASASTGGGYTPARKYMNAANSVRFLRRHPSLRGWAGFVLFDVLLWPAAFVNACLHGRPRAAFAKLAGIVDGLRGIQVGPEQVRRFMAPKSPR